MGVMDRMFSIFFGVWVVLALIGFYLFYINKNASFKRRFFPVFIISAGLLMIIFTLLLGVSLQMLFIVVPAVVLITYLNIRATKFCPQCGRTVHNGTWFHRLEYCPYCGAELDSRADSQR
jgi:predicted membrane protein